MSTQEIEQAIADLPEQERVQLREWLNEQVRTARKPSEGQADELRALAAAAGAHWEGGDGLDYQLRMRAEWDDRPARNR
ncbi:hypothetical protein [Rubrivirga sp.]|uniref:hypothetical protein n=1 Tax=Rubrivirga sp. TaxID=1885344 RepID=UPI003B5270CB